MHVDDDSCELCGVARESAHHDQPMVAGTIADVRRYGYHKLSVLEGEEDEPPFTYTVGLPHRFDHPEITVFGMDVEHGYGVVDTVVELIAAGISFSDGDVSHHVFVDRSATFRRVAKSAYPDFFQQAVNFHGNDDFSVLVVYWPDPAGKFPWEQGAPEWMSVAQPLLG